MARNPLPRAERDALLAHVGRYHLTLAPVLARLLGRETRRAHAVLEQLVAARQLSAHRQGRALYYTLGPAPLAPPALRQRFAVLWFCCMSDPPKPLLARADVERILAVARTRCHAAPLPAVACYLDAPRLCRLHPLPAITPGEVDLQQTLRHLQQLVRQATFRPWLLLAARARLQLTVLVPGAAAAMELDRWVARHPLVGSFAGTPGAQGFPAGAFVIPAQVVEMRLLRGSEGLA